MFENLSMPTKVLGAATAIAAIATVISAVKDHKDATVCECCCDECAEQLADPTAEN